MFKKLFGWSKGGKTGDRSKNKEAARFGIDPEMCYCPQCKEEYRPGISDCVTCGVALISGEERLAQARREHGEFAGRSMEISEDEPRVVVRGGKLRDLKAVQVLLAGQRIPALITGESGGCNRG